MAENKIVVFQEKNVRRVWHEGKWWFVVNDIVEVLTDTPNAADYLKKVRKRDEELAKGWGQIVTPLSVPTEGGKGGDNLSPPFGEFFIPLSYFF